MSSDGISSQPPIEQSSNTSSNTNVETAVETPPTSTDSDAQSSASPGWRRKSKKPLWPAVALAMLVVAGFVAVKAYRTLTAVPPSEDTEETANQSRLPVRILRAQTGPIQGWVFDEGAVWPVRRRILNFQASGDIIYVAKVDGIELREGDFVSQGQLLATIDARRQESSIATAEADIQVSETQLNQSRASLLQSQANLEKAKSDLALAETELQRYENLFEQGAVSESDRDSYINRVDQAAAALKTAEQDVRSADESIRSSEAGVNASVARLNQSAVDLEDTQLVSPLDGVVAYINIREGEYWSTQYLNTSSAQDLIESAPIVVVDPQSFEVEIELQAGEAGEITPGQRAYVVLEEEVSALQAAGANSQGLLDIARQRGSGGRVFAVSPSQTPGSRGTEITIRNLEQVGNLKVGGRVYVWIEVARDNDAVVLPLGALVSRNQQYYAFVVNEADGTVQQRRVTGGIEGLSGVEILSGIEPGELVVIEGQNRLVDGTPVEIVDRN
ncbi:multidrug resistance efflux pump [Leptolyngbya sp. Heron Island J]|uniref:efflux RND transporter periplasmic adaptor subunit n=1 Tax=Leptolyngbya sp. Heron Island J TaxID=1385935 RepID=UPI0003B9819E|nr:biotin/lipoyl-binding protein [Leptolyngbya sp. Heron Island J]ESA37033.1 multidrug resistance efflux pump [Leptolyngbya sp. Heron Island J]